MTLPIIITQLILPSTRDCHKPWFRIRNLELASSRLLQSWTRNSSRNTHCQSSPSIWDWSSTHPTSSIWEQIVWRCHRSSFCIFHHRIRRSSHFQSCSLWDDCVMATLQHAIQSTQTTQSWCWSFIRHAFQRKEMSSCIFCNQWWMSLLNWSCATIDQNYSSETIWMCCCSIALYSNSRVGPTLLGDDSSSMLDSRM